MFHADKQADMTKLTVAFRNIVKVPSNRIGKEGAYQVRKAWVGKITQRGLNKAYSSQILLGA
jgi:hypothetical protein